MSKGRALFVTLVYSGALFAVLYGIFILPVYTVTQDADAVYAALSIAVPFFAAFAFRRYIRTLLLFLLAHVVLLAAVLWLNSGLAMKLCYGGCTYLICVYSVVKRIKNEDEDIGAGFIATSLICLTTLRLFAGYMGFAPLYPIYPVLAGYVMISSLVFIHVTGLDSSLKIVTQTTQQPVRHILSFNNKMLAGFVLLLVVVALGSRYYHIDDALRLLGGLLLAALRFLFGLLPSAEEGVAVTEEAAEGGMDYSLLFNGEEKATPAILVILEVIVKYLAFIGMIVLVVAGIGYACYRIYKRFYEGGGAAGGDEKAFIAPSLETRGILMGRLRDILPFASPRERIRRLFYRKVNRSIAKGVGIMPSDTAGEIAGKMRQVENIDSLSKSYEEVRYGPQ